MGFFKAHWGCIKDSVSTINKEFFELIEEVSPGVNFPLYVLNFPYLSFIGDEKGVYIPVCSKKNDFFRLGDHQTPPEMMADLGYGSNTSPMAMIYKKKFEWYVSNSNTSSYPIHIDCPGDFFNTAHVTNLKAQKQYLPNGVLSVRSGVNSTFVIPKISCQKQHKRLKHFSLSNPPPKSYHEHSYIFQEISKARSHKTWHSSLIYFSEPWIKNIKNNPEWAKIKHYFIQSANQAKIYSSYSDYYSHIFRTAYDYTNKKTSLFIQDTLRYCFEILLGERFGFVPANDNEALPTELIVDAYENHYKTDTSATIMIPEKLPFLSNKPVYLSLQHTPFYVYEKNARGKVTRMKEIEIMNDCLSSYKTLFSKPIRECAGTFLEEVSKKACFNYYHNTPSSKSWLQEPYTLDKSDPRFLANSSLQKFPTEAPFFSGCISVSFNTN